MNWAVVRDDPGFRPVFSLARSRMTSIRFLHRLPQIQCTMTAISIHTAQVITCPTVDVGNNRCAVLVRLRRLLKPVPLREGLPFHRDSSPACCKLAYAAGLTYHLRIQHHERQPSIPFQRILPMEAMIIPFPRLSQKSRGIQRCAHSLAVAWRQS